MFAHKCPTAEPDDPRFKNLFVGPKQLAELFLHWKWAEFIDPVSRDKQFGHVPLATAIQLLEKYVFGRIRFLSLSIFQAFL
jgi:hypothetical protein